MKRRLFKRLIIRLGLVFVTLAYAGEPLGERLSFPEPLLTYPLLDHTQKEYEEHEAEALQIKNIEEEEKKLHSDSSSTKKSLTITSTPHIELNSRTSVTTPTKNPSSLDTLTEEERAALKAREHHAFAHAPTSSTAEHPTDLQLQLNFIRTKIVSHLSQELTLIKSKLTSEQIKNREMVIKFFDKAGELTEETLKTFRPLYKKLAEWDEKSNLNLTATEEKEMKLFLQSIITTYCTSHQSREKAS